MILLGLICIIFRGRSGSCFAVWLGIRRKISIVVVLVMTKVNISFRVQPWHYRALREELARGRSLTSFFEELLDERFPLRSGRL